MPPTPTPPTFTIQLFLVSLFSHSIFSLFLVHIFSLFPFDFFHAGLYPSSLSVLMYDVSLCPARWAPVVLHLLSPCAPNHEPVLPLGYTQPWTPLPLCQRLQRQLMVYPKDSRARERMLSHFGQDIDTETLWSFWILCFQIFRDFVTKSLWARCVLTYVVRACYIKCVFCIGK